MNTALLLIDLQKGFEDEAYWGGNRNNPDMEANITKLLSAWRGAGMPVVHVIHNSTESGSPLRPGQAGNEVVEYAQPLSGEPLFRKEVNSGFIGTGLGDYLKENQIDTLVLVGLTTNHCVSTTARMAGNLGFKAYVVSDATATFDRMGPDGTKYTAEQIHAISLANIHEEFVTVLPAEVALKSLILH